MKLNKDCIRELLLFVESLETPGANEADIIQFGTDNDYSKENLIYTIQRLDEAGFIDANVIYASNKVYFFNINYITYDGHQFIDSIRDSSVWSYVKKEAAKLKDVPLNVLAQLALSYIKNELNL